MADAAQLARDGYVVVRNGTGLKAGGGEKGGNEGGEKGGIEGGEEGGGEGGGRG